MGAARPRLVDGIGRRRRAVRRRTCCARAARSERRAGRTRSSAPPAVAVADPHRRRGRLTSTEAVAAARPTSQATRAPARSGCACRDERPSPAAPPVRPAAHEPTGARSRGRRGSSGCARPATPCTRAPSRALAVRGTAGRPSRPARSVADQQRLAAERHDRLRRATATSAAGRCTARRRADVREHRRADSSARRAAIAAARAAPAADRRHRANRSPTSPLASSGRDGGARRSTHGRRRPAASGDSDEGEQSVPPRVRPDAAAFLGPVPHRRLGALACRARELDQQPHAEARAALGRVGLAGSSATPAMSRCAHGTSPTKRRGTRRR